MNYEKYPPTTKNPGSMCWIYPRQDTVTEKITMYHPTYLFQTPSGVTQETVNRKGQARICDVAENHWSCGPSCDELGVQNKKR